MATIRDVARASSVSIATVSRVFNDSPLVSEDTRQRVMQAAQALGYWPNGIARSLITSRTHTLGVLLPDLHGEFFSEVIHGIDVAAREHGLHVLVSRASASRDEFAPALRSMRGRVDGMIVMAPEMASTTTLAGLCGQVPTVLLNPGGPFADCDTVAIASFEGAQRVVEHLIGLGHRRIATITGPPDNVDARRRLEGYRSALRDAGLPIAPELEFVGNFTEVSGYEGAVRLIHSEVRPEALFVANDHMAIGVLGAFHDHGVRVPEDLSVAGFDDIPMARYLTPPLTTVHVDMLQLGARAVHLLLAPAGRAPRAESRHETVPTTLVVRGSCGAAPRWTGSRACAGIAAARSARADDGGPPGRVEARMGGCGCAAGRVDLRLRTGRATRRERPRPRRRSTPGRWRFSTRSSAYVRLLLGAIPRTGLTPDRWPTPSFSSIAALGIRADGLPDRRRARLDHARAGARIA